MYIKCYYKSVCECADDANVYIVQIKEGFLLNKESFLIGIYKKQNRAEDGRIQ